MFVLGSQREPTGGPTETQENLSLPPLEVTQQASVEAGKVLGVISVRVCKKRFPGLGIRKQRSSANSQPSLSVTLRGCSKLPVPE